MLSEMLSEWYVTKTGNHQGLVVSESGENIAVVYDKKNSLLVASAPEGVELARQIVLDYESASGDYPKSDIPKDIYRGALALLAKAQVEA